MMMMGSDKRKIGAMILALASKEKPEPEDKEDEYTSMVKLTASKVIEAIKNNDAAMLIKELPKLLNNLPQPEVEFEDD